jgi:hypothetical protein
MIVYTSCVHIYHVIAEIEVVAHVDYGGSAVRVVVS